MNLATYYATVFTVRAAETLLHFTWVAALIIAAAIALGILLRRASPALHYRIFICALFCMAAAPPLIFLAPGFPMPPDLADLKLQIPVDENGEYSAADYLLTTMVAGPPRPYFAALPDRAAPVVTRAEQPWYAPAFWRTRDADSTAGWRRHAPAAVLLYLLLFVTAHLLLWLRLRFPSRLAASVSSIYDPSFSEIYQRTRERLGLRRRPAVGVSPLADAPMAVGMGTPVLVLPSALFSRFTMAQVERVLLYELLRVRRYDFVIDMLRRLMTAAFFYHPAVWAVSQHVRHLRDLCNDADAEALGGEPYSYTDALLASVRKSGSETPPRAFHLSWLARLIGRVSHAGNDASDSLRVHDQTLHWIHRPLGGAALLGIVLMIAAGVYIKAETPHCWPLKLTRPISEFYHKFVWDETLDVHANRLDDYAFALRVDTVRFHKDSGRMTAQTAVTTTAMFDEEYRITLAIYDRAGAELASASATMKTKVDASPTVEGLQRYSQERRSLALAPNGPIDGASRFKYTIETISEKTSPLPVLPEAIERLLRRPKPGARTNR